MSLAIVWAVHVADGVLDWPVLVAGFVVTGLLALVAARRIRDEEVPRIALLTAAFFVASSIHVRVGPTSVHLLLNGLVGVVLGWRAPLAILVGVTLQALLIPHGGLTTIGVNAAVEAIPAVAAGMLFPLLRRSRRAWLVGGSAVLWGGLLVFTAAALATNPWRDLVRLSAEAGLVVRVENWRPAVDVLLAPVTLALLAAFAGACVWGERRLETTPEFPAGAVVGAFAVVATTLLAGLVLVADGAERWGTFATAVFVVHLPLALVEGLILGVTVGFLARVKPEMLPAHVVQAAVVNPRPDRQGGRDYEGPTVREGAELTAGCAAPSLTVGPSICNGPGQQAARSTTTGLALLALLSCAGPALAHLLEVEVKRIDLKAKRVTVESSYETGDAPKDATAKVFRGDGSVLAEGPLDAKGAFQFPYDNAEPLRVQISAPGGHRASVRITAKELGAPEEESTPHVAGEDRSRGRDLMLGVTFLLALTAFVISLRNARQLRESAKR